VIQDMELREEFGSLLFKINTLGKFNVGRFPGLRGPITLNMGW
jgi:hypothetical protein